MKTFCASRNQYFSQIWKLQVHLRYAYCILGKHSMLLKEYFCRLQHCSFSSRIRGLATRKIPLFYAHVF